MCMNIKLQDLESFVAKDKMSNRTLYKQSDSFIFVGMSHGRKGAIYDRNYWPISIEDDIIAWFDGFQCRELIRKPKLFFFQACQNRPGKKATTVVL